MASLPVPSLGGRVINYPQGKVAGGTGSINGMLYVRSHRAEHDHWVEAGCAGWSYEETLPFYERAEGVFSNSDRDASISVEPLLESHILSERFIDAAAELGFRRLSSLNAGQREGAAAFHQTRRGRFRGGPGQTYFRRARQRDNVITYMDALARRVLFEGRSAAGVEFEQGGEVKRMRARREVIIANGVLRSPQLLHVSGIGPAEHLKSIGVDVVADRPSVGDDLRDHYSTRIACRVRGVVTLNERTRGLSLARELARYALFGRGLLTLGASSAAVFARSRPELAEPDLQLSFAPGSFQPGSYKLETEPGMTIAMYPSYPQSRGWVRAKAGGTREMPDIQPNYLSAEADRKCVLAGLRLMRSLFDASAFAPYEPKEIRPGPSVRSDDELIAYAQEQGVSGFHFAGTCRMGGDDSSVVTPELKVRGVDRLRVIDASVMPTCTSGNNNAPTIMVAEKGAAMLLAR